VAGAVPIVDVDNRNAGGTGVEHRQQRRYALECGAVPDRRRYGDHRRGDEPGNQPRQCTVHSGDNDDDAGGPELVEPTQDALQPGDTDIDNQISRAAEIGRGQLGLSGNSQVLRAGGYDQDASAASGRWLRRPGNQLRDVFLMGVGKFEQDRLGVRRARPGEQRCGAGPPDGPGNGADLLRGLSLAEHGLWVAASPRPVVIEFEIGGQRLIRLPVLSHGCLASADNVNTPDWMPSTSTATN